MTVIADVSAATIERRIAHHGRPAAPEEIVRRASLPPADPGARGDNAEDVGGGDDPIHAAHGRQRKGPGEVFSRPTVRPCVRAAYTVKLLPHPQPPVAFGLSKVNPLLCIVTM